MAKHLKHGKSLAEKENDNQRVKETVESVLKQIEKDGDKAVSYTHLTLPTIYSV